MENNIKKSINIKNIIITLLFMSLNFSYFWDKNDQKNIKDNEKGIKIEDFEKKNNTLLSVFLISLVLLAVSVVIVIVVKRLRKNTSTGVGDGSKNRKHTSMGVLNGATNGKDTSKDVSDESNTSNEIIGKAQTPIHQGDHLTQQENIEQKYFKPLYSEETYQDIEFFDDSSDSQKITKSLGLTSLYKSDDVKTDKMYSAQIAQKNFYCSNGYTGTNIPDDVMEEIESYKNSYDDKKNHHFLLDKKFYFYDDTDKINYHPNVEVNTKDNIIKIYKPEDIEQQGEYLSFLRNPNDSNIKKIDKNFKYKSIVFFEENSRIFFILYFYKYNDKNYAKLYFKTHFLNPHDKYAFCDLNNDDFDPDNNDTQLASYQKKGLDWFGINNKKEFNIAFMNFEIEATNNINQLIESLQQCKENNETNSQNRGTELSIKLNGRTMRVKHFFEDGYNLSSQPISIVCFPDKKND